MDHSHSLDYGPIGVTGKANGAALLRHEHLETSGLDVEIDAVGGIGFLACEDVRRG